MRRPRNPGLGMTFATGIFGAHPDVIGDETCPDDVPKGWRDLLAGLAASWAELLRADGARIIVSRISVRAGGLVIAVEVDEARAPSQDALTEIRRLRTEAEHRSLQACEHCGGHAVLRHWPDAVYAVRCDRHMGTAVRGVGREAPAASSDVIDNLLISHRAWLRRHAAAFVEVPRGWVPLAVETFKRFRMLPTGQGLLLLSMRAVLGRLEIRLEHDIDDFSVDEYLDWRAAVRALGDAAAFTCDVCGEDGFVRPTDAGVPTPRCDAHSDLARWPSYQWSAPTRDDPVLAVITSARPQLTLEAVWGRVTAPEARRQGEVSPSDGHELYRLDAVSAALGLAAETGRDDTDRSPPSDSEQQARLRRILDRGDAARWRRLVRPSPEMVRALDELGSQAPHLAGLTETLRRHLLAAINVGLPIQVPPLLVLGKPGLGKTWFLTRFARLLGVPFRSYPMSGASHSDTVGGAAPIWRNSQAGLPARTLLSEDVANPLIFVDEFDKVPPSASMDDLYRPFYSLLEPIGSSGFVDAYLQFPMDASRINWLFAANSVDLIPSPILSRLTVIEVPPPSREHSAAIAASIYADASAARRGYFEACPPEVVERLADLGPREMRIAVEHAMTAAASERRSRLDVKDLPVREAGRRPRIGFV